LNGLRDAARLVVHRQDRFARRLDSGPATLGQRDCRGRNGRLACPSHPFPFVRLIGASTWRAIQDHWSWVDH
jgi:hypothetical protein